MTGESEMGLPGGDAAVPDTSDLPTFDDGR
jgi:hypothetical protein